MHARPQLAALCVAALCVGFASGAAPAPKKEEAAELTVTECKASNASKWTKVGKQLKSGGMCLTVDGCDIPGASESTGHKVTMMACGGGCAEKKKEAQEWDVGGAASAGSAGIVSGLTPQQVPGVQAIEYCLTVSRPTGIAIVFQCYLPSTVLKNQNFALNKKDNTITVGPDMSAGVSVIVPPQCKKDPCCLAAPGGAMGWTIVIILGVALVVVPGGAVGYNMKAKGLQGSDAVPEIFMMLPGLVKDGIAFAKSKVPQQGYEAVGEGDGSTGGDAEQGGGGEEDAPKKKKKKKKKQDDT